MSEAVGEADVVRDVGDAQAGSAQAFGRLYDRYVNQVFGYVYHRIGDRQLAEDLTSDVFLRALQRIGSFRWQGRDFGAWLMTIARNRVNDHFKSARFRLTTPVWEVFDAAQEHPGGDDPEQAAFSRETARQVYEAMKQLPSSQAEVLYLRFIQHLSIAQAGRVMGKKEGAIKALQYRALRSLAKALPEDVA